LLISLGSCALLPGVELGRFIQSAIRRRELIAENHKVLGTFITGSVGITNQGQAGTWARSSVRKFAHLCLKPQSSFPLIR